MRRIVLTCRDRGVFELPSGRYGNVLRIAPPLVITKAHIDRALEIVHGILKEVEGDVLE